MRNQANHTRLAHWRILALWVLIPCVLGVRSDSTKAGEAPATTPASQPGQQSEKPKRTSLFHIGQNVVGLPPAVQVLAIVGGTLVSEDLTCISVGTLIHARKIPWMRGGAACFLGIYIGDLLFFFLGRIAGARLLKMRFFSRSLGETRLKQFGEWFDRKPWAAIMACRFLPGIRVPLYLSVGALSHRTKAFFWWTCFFAFVWTPALIGGVVLLGDAIVKPLEFVFGTGWWIIPLTIAVIFTIVKLVILLSTAEGRKKLKGWFARPFIGRDGATPKAEGSVETERSDASGAAP